MSSGIHVVCVGVSVINCSFPLSLFYYYFPFSFFSIYSMGKYVTACDRESDKVTSMVMSQVMSHMTLVGSVG